MPNSGKTYLGEYLSKTLHRPHYDMDHFTYEYMPFYNTKKEWYQYRKKEFDILKELVHKSEPSIISTGGGCIEYANTFEFLMNMNRSDCLIIHVLKEHSLQKPNPILSDTWDNLWLKRGKYYFMLSDINYWNERNQNYLLDEIQDYRSVE